MMKQLLVIFALVAICICAQEVNESLPQAEKALKESQPAIVSASEEAVPEEEEKKGVEGKVSISADRMEMVLEKVAKLDGNVEIVFIPEGQTLEDLKKQVKSSDVRIILNADHITVFFPEKAAVTEKDEASKEPKANAVSGAKTSSSAPSKIMASGRVKIHTPDGKSATGEQAVWDFTNGNSIMLEGKCTIMSEGHILTSPKVTYNMEENRFVASRAVITLPVGNSTMKNKDLPGLDALPKTKEKK